MKRTVFIFALLLAVRAPSYGQKSQPPAGYSPERLARIAPAMNRLIGEGKFPGISVTVAKNGRVIYDERFGFADMEIQVRVKNLVYQALLND